MHGRKVSLAKRSSERLKLGTLNFEILLWTFQTFTFTVPKFYFELFKLLRLEFQCLTLGTLNFEIFKVSLAKRSSEHLTLGTLKFEILLWTFQF